jgi:hypothetical protein
MTEVETTAREQLTYQLWAHQRTGCIYAVRIEAGEVTGACGPLPLWWVAEEDLSVLDYSDCPTSTERAREHPKQFVFAEPWARGEHVPVGPQAWHDRLRRWVERLRPAGRRVSATPGESRLRSPSVNGGASP